MKKFFNPLKKTQSNVFTLVNDNLLIVAEKDKLKKYWIDDDENVQSEEIIQIETINEIASVEETIFCLQETTTGSKLIEVKNGEKREFDLELDFDPIFASQDNWILTNHVRLNSGVCIFLRTVFFLIFLQ